MGIDCIKNDIPPTFSVALVEVVVLEVQEGEDRQCRRSQQPPSLLSLLFQQWLWLWLLL